MALLIDCMAVGVFNRHYANGGVSFFAYALVNVYVYFMAFLQWPVLTLATYSEKDAKKLAESEVLQAELQDEL